MTTAETKNSGSMFGELRGWFTAPPRAHGEVVEGRVVSFLELFYDLVFVVLIAQIAHTLADDVSWVGVRNFGIVFALIWVAWINGSFYHELHGGEDGRSRTYIFVQMMLLVLLAVYASHAADDLQDGRGFAIVYAILLSFIAFQWFGIRKYDTPEMAALTGRYVMGMVVTIVFIGGSAFVNDLDTRLGLWAVAIVLTIVGSLGAILRPDPTYESAFAISESMAERFGLFTIIVLGEVVVGVADGLADQPERTARTIATGVFALTVGFGFWWNYFDFVGRREPKLGAIRRAVWNLGHLPLWLGIAAAGAGMVSLVEHAGDSRTPAATAWLVTVAVAMMTLSLAAINATMRPLPGRRGVPYMLVGAAVAALVLGALRPTPLVMVVALNLVLSTVWTEAFLRHARGGTVINGQSQVTASHR